MLREDSMKVYWDIYHGGRKGQGDYICSVESEEIATDICKNHPKYFPVMRIIKDKDSDED